MKTILLLAALAVEIQYHLGAKIAIISSILSNDGLSCILTCLQSATSWFSAVFPTDFNGSSFSTFVLISTGSRPS